MSVSWSTLGAERHGIPCEENAFEGQFKETWMVDVSAAGSLFWERKGKS